MCAQSTRGLTTLLALYKRVSMQEDHAAASWSSPHTLSRFYRLDVMAPPLVLSVSNFKKVLNKGQLALDDICPVIRSQCCET